MKHVISRIMLAFKLSAFRWLWLGSNFGFMSMMASDLTLGWLVLELTDSPFWVGVVAAGRGVAQVLFSLFAGVVLDRYDKRRVLLLVQVGNMLLPLGLGMLLLSGRVMLWHLLLAGVVQGGLTAVRAPAFNTMTYQLVGAQRILNASAALGLGFNLALVVGSAVTGVLVEQYGEASGLFFAAIAGTAGIVSILLVGGSFTAATRSEPLLQAAVAGVRYASGNQELLRLLLLSLFIETFGFSHHVMLPVIARDVLGLGAAGLGALSSARGIGAMLSNLGIAALGDYEHKGYLLVSTVVGAGFFLMLFGLSRWYELSLLLVFAAGAALAAYDATMKALVLLQAEDDWRGRVQSLYTLTFGFVSIGGFVAGTVATAVSVSFALVMNGGIILAFVGKNGRSLRQLGTPIAATPQAAD